jgi:uncharacterized membrane protein YdjX (TVP38/TMEM64 family)
MTDETPGLQGHRYGQRTRNLMRSLAILVFCVLAAMLLSVDAVYQGMQKLLMAAEPVIAARPIVGAAVFMLLAAASAVLAFFSSALLVPAALVSFGPLVTMLLLWAGWLLGGMFAYALGQAFRRPEGQPSRLPPKIAARLARAPKEIGFSLLLLWQLVLPSEVTGYVSGYLGVRFRTYVSAAAVAELPYAAGATMLGETVVNRQAGGLVLMGVAAAILGYVLVRRLHRADHAQ